MIFLKDSTVVVVVGAAIGVVILFYIGHLISSVFSNGENKW